VTRFHRPRARTILRSRFMKVNWRKVGRLPALLAIVFLFVLPVRAEDVLATVQRELRARKFYFGEIQGHATEETVAAIRKFQEARGIDHSGNLDVDTLRALGLHAADGAKDETKVLQECCDFVLRYVQARESGSWEREGPLFATTVNYYNDGVVTRDFIRNTRERYNTRWPKRKLTLLQRVAALVHDQKNEVQVTARVRVEISSASDEPQANTEDLLFRLEKGDEGWRIAAVKLL
jgi:peptidoglycan hydrolase-like protein with peptidoglycan-binding domain